jgi:hypothetical protein
MKTTMAAMARKARLVQAALGNKPWPAGVSARTRWYWIRKTAKLVRAHAEILLRKRQRALTSL